MSQGAFLACRHSLNLKGDFSGYSVESGFDKLTRAGCGVLEEKRTSIAGLCKEQKSVLVKVPY